ncbi:MAG: ABC transporter ATP-binding protein [Chloroflexota bacterium]|nr:ABC transporter ATP-binding protein [Chloroflexota bacterium]
MDAILAVEDLRVSFAAHAAMFTRDRRRIVAVDGVSFALGPGETLALVGESGSGKSTVARAILGLVPYSGTIRIDGRDVAKLPRGERRALTRRLQMVFQDPYSSLDPSMRVEDIVAEPLDIHEHLGGGARRDRVRELLDAVGLSRDFAARFPAQLSGGQRQRVAIARAVILRPSVLVCDEAVSALDVSTQAQVIRVLAELTREMHMSNIFITHDLALAAKIADRVAVMYFGKMVEVGTSATVFPAPAHPYTQCLLSAVPIPHPRVQRGRQPIPMIGELPNALQRPEGCLFHPRCPKAMEVCRREAPAITTAADGRLVACHLVTARDAS